MKTILQIYIFTILLYFLSGCSALTIGRETSMCEGEYCDYSEAGVCKDTITIYKNRHQLENRVVLHRTILSDEDPYISSDDN